MTAFARLTCGPRRGGEWGYEQLHTLQMNMSTPTRGVPIVCLLPSYGNYRVICLSTGLI